ncbi:hypothetical protein D3C84_1060950 [compost metagenome]
MDAHHAHRSVGGQALVDQRPQPIMERMEQALLAIFARGLVQVMVARDLVDLALGRNAVRHMQRPVEVN